MTYHPKKPHKRGMTAWTLADARTGYVFNQELFTKKDQAAGATRRTVRALCQPIRGKKHHVYMDNYFSSPDLFRDLADMSCGACGTLRLDRVGTPQVIRRANPAVGDAVFDRQGDQLFMVWKDKRKVSLLTTLHNSNIYQKRRRERHGPNIEEINKPCAIELYTQYMGGVDRADRLVWTYLHIHRSLKWWKKVFIYLLEVSFVNAVIIYRSIRPGEKHPLDQLRLDLIDGLLEGWERGSTRAGRPPTDQPQRISRSAHQLVFTSQKTPSGKPSKPECVVCSDKNTGRRHQTEMVCKECNKAMCPVPCFWRYHNLVEYKAVCTKEYHHPH